MRDILLITNYWHFEEEKASSRYFTLANMIVESGLNLEIITSTFYHATKSQRKFDNQFISSFPYKITLINEPGYSKNISLMRLLSHRKFAQNVIKYLRERKKPDVVYCVVPSLDVAQAVSKYCNDNNIENIIDIQDLWPEAFRMAVNIPILSDILFYPLTRKANYVYSSADIIVAVSESYVKRALSVNNKTKNANSIYLGTELSKFDMYASESANISKPPNELWIAYVGTLSHSYDLTSAIDAIKILSDNGYGNLKLIVMGDGPLKTKFEDHASTQKVKVIFTGKLEYRKMVNLLVNCDIAVNPIVKRSVASIINKHADYVAAGLPILNTQESSEFRSLLIDYNAGFNCKNNNPKDISEKLLLLYKNPQLRKEMGTNARRLAEDKFNREVSYQKIIELLS